jgi:hypothetical protein
MDCNLRWPGLLGALLTILCLSTQLVIAEDVESPKDDIAAQIRADRGFRAQRSAQSEEGDTPGLTWRCYPQ